ncbi:CLI_3235 family bacteriocin precursor [Paenibacillus macerans]|uniref:CLI_3235 family bacteriocin n=1 Tax=Paenibacillus macerans TaxID=44252 RepID=A0A6N8EVR5_PAEMA|nr:CLI_3235 family bacteriocin precursor [Paenibacillus macerans]
MKKLGKKLHSTYETVEAFACICNCFCSGRCVCSPVLASYNNLNLYDNNIVSKNASSF